VSVAAGTCLASRCLETALLYLLISRSLHSNSSTRYNIVAFFPDNATSNLWVLDLTLDLLGSTFFGIYAVFCRCGGGVVGKGRRKSVKESICTVILRKICVMLRIWDCVCRYSCHSYANCKGSYKQFSRHGNNSGITYAEYNTEHIETTATNRQI
jgi:hypothetical protein